jgi:hypothetical protein
MKRKEQIDEFAYSQVDCEFFNENLYEGIIIGAKWADEHPDSRHVYTKKQLLDMGFAFTTNGDIVTPEQSNEDLKKYLKYQKQKFIEKACKWLQENLSEGSDPDNYPMVRCYDIDMEDFINDFSREMEE